MIFRSYLEKRLLLRTSPISTAILRNTNPKRPVAGHARGRQQLFRTPNWQRD